ncbi:rod shape-determining protein MreD [Limibacterium fermenti]|uniref:rod shape-determining protein MreD n=1 Tax=Limibacterium fermenti TaxID=3229863 RepID=UPI000E8D59BE|nr:rod shape-determining protein MreD [Porphyromonadaceae bacterium]
MKLSYIYEVFLLALLVLLQTLLLNRIHLFGVATPVLYIYFLLKLPIGRNPFYVIISGFMMGLLIDIFLNTPGMNAAATTIVAAFRKPVINLIFGREDYEQYVPGIHSSTGPFVRFTILMVVFHQTLLFFIESFTFFNITHTLLLIISSSLITCILIFALDSLTHNSNPREQS